MLKLTGPSGPSARHGGSIEGPGRSGRERALVGLGVTASPPRLRRLSPSPLLPCQRRTFWAVCHYQRMSTDSNYDMTYSSPRPYHAVLGQLILAIRGADLEQGLDA